ncbi:MAG: hypothetical protein JXR96_03155 [Deltaproteobacteria bacterium]|nr:hypothetical protein [Deltaproteobacteria bacterium]
MKRLVWIAVCALLLAAVYICGWVPLGGRTLVERVLGPDPQAAGPETGAAAREAEPDGGPGAEPEREPQPGPGTRAGEQDPDVHTEKEQRDLTRLIERKLGGGEAGGR